MTDTLDSIEHMMAAPENAEPDLQEAILNGVIELTDNYEAFRTGKRDIFFAYFVYCNPVHEGQQQLLCDELGITPHPSKPDTVITLDGVELHVTIGCFDATEGDKPVPYDIRYSTSENGFFLAEPQSSSAAEV